MFAIQTMDRNIRSLGGAMLKESVPGSLLKITILILVLSSPVTLTHGDNDRIITPKHYVPSLTSAQSILLDVEILGREGRVDPGPVREVSTRRLEGVGFTVTAEAGASHDVVVRIRCREPVPPPGPDATSGSRDDRILSPTFRGPPCLVRYLVAQRPMDWQRVDRIVFTMGVQAAERVSSGNRPLEPGEYLARFLEEYEYPLLLAAEWGQSKRLLGLLKTPATDPRRRATIIALLGEIRAEDSIPCLTESLQNDALVRDAALALGNFGVEVRMPLVALLQTSPRSDVQAAAARSLGMIGATSGDWSLAPLFVQVLKEPGLDLSVKVELVWALGKSPDRDSLPVLEELYKEAWRTRSNDPRLQELRKAIDWSHRSVRLGGHTDEY